MKLNDLVRHIDHTGASDAEITAIVYDSRKAKPGALFVCLVGAWMDGHTLPKAPTTRAAAPFWPSTRWTCRRRGADHHG